MPRTHEKVMEEQFGPMLKPMSRARSMRAARISTRSKSVVRQATPDRALDPGTGGATSLV